MAAYLLAFIFALFHFPATIYTHMVDTVSASVVRVTGLNEAGDHFVCSGFVIRESRVLTASHCVGTMVQADGLAVTVIKVDPYYDLAVLDVKTNKHTLTFQDAPVYRFEPVTAVGYAWGATVLTALQARIDIYDYAIAEDEAPGIVVQNAYIGGMSGGPVVDESGAVVSIAQRAYSGMGFGVGTKLISAFLVGVR